MSTFELVPHPDHPPLAVRGVEVEALRQRDDLLLTYSVSGGQRVHWPEPMPFERADDLWRATCFELFLMFDDQECYVEFNFSPSTRWAAYRFEGHREGKSPLEVGEPKVERRSDGVAVTCPLSGLPYGALAMGLSAVVEEEEDGNFSYWALAHPPGAPDFHHPACFRATLPPPAAR